jgi:HEAT repeats
MTTPAPPASPEPSPGGPPVETKRSRRVYVYWGIALTLLATVGLVCWLVVVPVWRVRKVVQLYAPPPAYDKTGTFLEEIGVNWGGRGSLELQPMPASTDIEAYLRMPRVVAADKERAVCMLYECGESGVPVLVRTLESPEVRLRMAGVWTLRKLGSRAREAVPALIRALQDEHYTVRWLSAQALGRIGSSESTVALTTAQQDEVEDVRVAAAEALKKVKAAEQKDK